jgi:MFS family permease
MAGFAVIAGLRLLDGLALGNDAAAGLSYLAEHAPTRPSLHAAVVPAAMAAGAGAAAGLALVLALAMPAGVLAASGWRVVLVASLLSNALAGLLRGTVLQQPVLSAAEQADQANLHVGRVIR